MTSAPKAGRFPALDGVRALAAFSVVVTHVGFTTSRSVQSDLFGPIIARADFGVTVFFLLSGFLLYRPFALYSFGLSGRPHVIEYLWRRALRILPALWVMVPIVLTFVTVFRVRAADWWHYLLLIQTYDHHDYDPHLTQLWTLTVEISFYALLPIIAAVVGGPKRSADSVLRRQMAVMAVLFVLALTYNVVVSHGRLTNTQALLWLPAYLDWFGAGMTLAILSAVPQGTLAFARPRWTAGVWAENRGACWLLAGVVFLISTLPIGIPRTLAPATFWQWTTEHYLYLVAAFLILLPFILTGGGRAGTVLGSAPARFFGNVSYSVYLWHVPVMLWLQRHLGFEEFHGHFLELLGVTAAVTLAIATLSWFVVERPILRYGSRPWRGAFRAGRRDGTTVERDAESTAAAKPAMHKS